MFYRSKPGLKCRWKIPRTRSADSSTGRRRAPLYRILKLWDTYRTLHPLFTLIQPERTEEFIRTMLRMYDQRNDLPVWELACETECMIGYHSVSAIADAYMKGYNDFDTTKALDAMVRSASWMNGPKKNTLQGFISDSDRKQNPYLKHLNMPMMIFVLPKWLKKWDVMTFTKNLQIAALIL